MCDFSIDTVALVASFIFLILLSCGFLFNLCSIISKVKKGKDPWAEEPAQLEYKPFTSVKKGVYKDILKTVDLLKKQKAFSTLSQYREDKGLAIKHTQISAYVDFLFGHHLRPNTMLKYLHLLVEQGILFEVSKGEYLLPYDKKD